MPRPYFKEDETAPVRTAKILSKIAARGNRFKLDRGLEEWFHLEGNPQIATNFALVRCTGAVDVVLENLAVDGNKAHMKCSV